MEILGWLVIGLAPLYAIILGFGAVCFANIGGAADRKDYLIGWGVVALGAFMAYHWWLIKPFTLSVGAA